MMTQQIQSDVSHQADLMHVLKFDDTDLEANRQGVMSATQRTQVKKEQIGLASAWALGGAIPIGIMLFPPPEVRGVTWPFMIVMLVCLGVSVWVLSVLRAALAQNEVKSVEGEAYPTSPEFWSPYGSAPFINIMGEEFRVPLATQTLMSGTRYRLYFLSSPRRIMSAEVIHKI